MTLEHDPRAVKSGAPPADTVLVDRMVEAAYPLPRRLCRALNYPGVFLDFRHSGDSWSLAWEHTHLWVWGFIPAPSERR